MKKTNVFLILVVILLLATLLVLLCFNLFSQKTDAPATEPETQNVETVDWKGIYKDFLLKQDYMSYARLADLNFDGTPELLFSYTAASASECLNIYEIIDNKLELRSGFEEYGHPNTSLAGKNYYLHDTYSPDALPSYFPRDVYTEKILKKSKSNNTYMYMWHSKNGSDMSSFGTHTIFDWESDIVEISTYFYECTKYNEEYEVESTEYVIKDKSYDKEEYERIKSEFFSGWDDVDYPVAACGIKIGNQKLPKDFIVIDDSGKIKEKEIDKLFELYIPETEYLNISK